jgi:hypothetical protein
MTFGAHLFGLLNVSQAGLEPVALVVTVAEAATHLFSQSNVVWRSIPWAKSSGCQGFDSPWCFTSAKCGFSISARFWSHRAHAFWFCTLVAILEHHQVFLKSVIQPSSPQRTALFALKLIIFGLVISKSTI